MPVTNYDQDLTNSQYDQITKGALEFALAKDGDYGSSWTIMRKSGFTDQIYAKLLRIRSIQEAGTQLVKDDLRGEFLAVLNYSIMAISVMEPGVANDFKLTKERLNELFGKVIREARDLMQKKNHDYGEAFRVMRISSLVDMMLMRILRMISIESNN